MAVTSKGSKRDRPTISKMTGLPVLSTRLIAEWDRYILEMIDYGTGTMPGEGFEYMQRLGRVTKAGRASYSEIMRHLR